MPLMYKGDTKINVAPDQVEQLKAAGFSFNKDQIKKESVVTEVKKSKPSVSRIARG